MIDACTKKLYIILYACTKRILFFDRPRAKTIVYVGTKDQKQDPPVQLRRFVEILWIAVLEPYAANNVLVST